MRHVPIRRRRPRAAAAALVCVAALAAATTTAAAKPAGAGPDWYGWALKVRFAGSAPVVTFIVYVGRNGSPPVVLASQATDISSTCQNRGPGTITYPQPTTARFDGKSYLRCTVPSWAVESAKLGFPLPGGGGQPLTSPPGSSPLWVDHRLRPDAISAAMPVIDASNLGFSMDVQSTGSLARTRLRLARPSGGFITYQSSQWAAGSDQRTVLGMGGRQLVAVADRFNMLDYLTDPDWRKFYRTTVTGNRLGSWVEAPTVRSTVTGSSYRLRVDGGPITIGFSPSTGKFFQGTITAADADPGSHGI